MFNYTTGEAALLVLLQSVNGFDSKNTSIANWKLLNKGEGLTGVYAIIKKGETTRTWITMRQIQVQSRSIIEVWKRYKDDSTTYSELLEHVDSITARVDKYRMLDDDSGTVFDANCTGSSAVMEQWRQKGDGPSWLKQDIYVDWSEQNVIELAE